MGATTLGMCLVIFTSHRTMKQTITNCWVFWSQPPIGYIFHELVNITSKKYINNYIRYIYELVVNVTILEVCPKITIVEILTNK